jgi:asparagine synthase (glutamine-hydrolysing)
LYYVAKLARDNGVIVCHVGEGADELFIGYPNWKRMLRLQSLSNTLPQLDWVKDIGLAMLRACSKDGAQPYAWLERSRVGVPIFWGGAHGFTESTKMRVLSPRLRERFHGRTAWEALAPIHDRYIRNTTAPSILGWMSYLDLNFRLPELLLMRVDKMTMGNGVEARVPFLDHDVVEFALGIPDAVKLQDGELKAILKRAVRGTIPDSIIRRPKQGFAAPIKEWFMSELPDDIAASVKRFAAETDLVDGQTVNEIFAAGGRAEWQWPLLNLALWWERFVRSPRSSSAFGCTNHVA